MVAIRRHNPHLRTRNKKDGGGGAVTVNVKYAVRLAFVGLLLLSLSLAGYLLRRVGQTQQQQQLSPAATTSTKKVGGGAGSIAANNPHHVHMGDEHGAQHPRLRRPIEIQHDPDEEETKKSKSLPETVAATDPHHVDVEMYHEGDEAAGGGGGSLTSSPTHAPPADADNHKSSSVPETPPPPHHDDAAAHDNKVVAEKHAIVLDTQGGGPTDLGFVKDLAYERAHPAFWQPDAAWLTERTAKASKTAGTSLQSCTSVSGELNSVCKDADTMLYAYNGANFSRTVCGLEVPPLEIVKLDSLTDHECLAEPAHHILPRDMMQPSAQGMPAIQIVAHANGAQTAKMQTVPCDVPCSYDVSLLYEDPPRERYVEGEEWKILYDSPESVRSMEKTDYKRDIYYSGVSRLSSIPVSTFDFEKYDFHNAPAVDWGTAQRGAGYFADDNCQAGGTRRHKWMMALKAKYPVFAYGNCQHDTDAGDLSTMEARIATMAKNRLVLAFETSGERDAFSPLTWEAFLSGAVPVVVGPSNAVELLPKNSFLWYGNYNQWDKFADHVLAVADNKTAWESYQTWRQDEAEIAAFEKRMNFTRTKVECRTCRWAYSKMYGLSWDGDQQYIKPSIIPRDKFCLSAQEQVTKPFLEMWSKQEEQGGQEDAKCETTLTHSETTIETDDYQVTRQVWHHDGVTDILVKRAEASNQNIPIVLRLDFDVKNFEGAYFPHPHTTVESQNHHLVSSASMQDFNSRVTVLADFNTSIASPEEGSMEIVLPSSIQETRRIRVIIEDVDRVNFKLTEFYPFSFGKKMTLDFTNPIELYYPATAR